MVKLQIRELLKHYLEIVNNNSNKRNRKFWQSIYSWNRDMWRGIPNRISNIGPIQFTVALDNSLWSEILQVNLKDYYSNPETFLETQLRR